MQPQLRVCTTFGLLALTLLTTSISAKPLADAVDGDADIAALPPVVAAVAAESLTTAQPSAAPPAAPDAAAPQPTIAEFIAPPAPPASPSESAAPPTGGPIIPIDLPIELPFANLPPPRRVVSYDQRQEGKYNIRADLENFMIVVIPSSPSSGASLLDLLTRTNQLGAPKNQGARPPAAASKKDGPHKKYHAPGPGSKGGELQLALLQQQQQQQHPLRSKASLTSKANLVLLQEAVSAELARRDGLQAAQQQQQQQPAFIEGRTPYHVDISSAAPAARPLIYARAARPEQTLLPLQRHTKSLNNGGHAAPVELAHNSVVLVGRLPLAVAPPSPFARHAPQQRGFAWADVFDRSADRYDALLRGGDDADEDDENSASADSVDRLAAGETSKSGNDGGWDQLTLLGADEQCGPDRRRDSYGVCQFVALD